ncbi:MAG: hypothetical protein KDL10_08840, partial [Kiritimatiellae bacterium]|nr:hypothetical protein [Kiritimatiellia bacterium]
MSSLRERIKTHRLRAERQGKEVDEAALKAIVEKSKEIDAPLKQEGFGGRGRAIRAIERNHVIAINQNSSPFEWLAAKGYLETRDDVAGIGNARFSAGLRLRDIMIGAEPSGLKTFDLERSGGGGVPMMISDFKMDCIKLLTRIRNELSTPKPSRLHRRKRVETELFSILERIVYREEWIFEVKDKRRNKVAAQRKQKAIMQRLHYGLDTLALMFGMITPQEFDARWNRPSTSSK